MADELVQIPAKSIGSIIVLDLYDLSLWIIPIAIILFFIYKVFRKEEFFNKKKVGIIFIFLVIYVLFGIGHTFFVADYNFFEVLINHRVTDALSMVFLWPSIYGTFLWGAQIIGGVLLILFAWLSYWIGNKLFKE